MKMTLAKLLCLLNLPGYFTNILELNPEQLNHSFLWWKKILIKVLSRFREPLFWRSWWVTASTDVCFPENIASSEARLTFLWRRGSLCTLKTLYVNQRTHSPAWQREVRLRSLSWLITEDNNRMQFHTQTRFSCYDDAQRNHCASLS